ncbi:galactoside 2-alpha-L-fucosyltransferase [Amborella trichopoda]|nr:galactoside 2-alpha-L-fucosyltransferase [Amborella trichopoda]|eukprot:XP_006827324.2 galactoside 2-alpha-L-fucosyltransferase [Amborella trichopoda]
MDMKRFRRHFSETGGDLISSTDPATMSRERKVLGGGGVKIVRVIGICILGCLIILPLLFTISLLFQDHPPPTKQWVSDVNEEERITSLRKDDDEEEGFWKNNFGGKQGKAGGKRRFHGHTQEEEKTVPEDGLSMEAQKSEDRLLGGLLAANFDEGTCLSRYQSSSYRKLSPHKPSSYLIGKIRKYEALYKQCGPDTESYNEAITQLKRGQQIRSSSCKYLVWISYSGLGNRIVTLAATFLYALLTDRVLLIDRGTDMGDLFCEPFPEKSWLLPLDFPLNQFDNFHVKSPERYGLMLRDEIINENGTSSGSFPAFVYLHLAHDYDKGDKLFFCDREQLILDGIPWLLLRSDNYFVPSLFLVPKFSEELEKLFPEKVTVFHHLGRYLFHPSNTVWGLITRFYRAYLANAEERVGIQIRTFDTGVGPFQHVLDQILACALNEKLLPAVSRDKPIIPPQQTGKTDRKPKVVLMTSLSGGYYERIRNMYWEYPTVTGEVISIYQPSHEEHQQTEKQFHNMKAWAEMYLLSLSDTLITSPWSTFGYVAQGLGGLRPWIMVKPVNHTTPNPACGRAISMEPCFHAPPFYDCKAKRGIDTGKLVPHVRHCEDMSWGLKLVGEN